MYSSRGVDWPLFSSNSGVPPAYMVPGGSPNGFNPFAASCRSRHDPAAGGGGASSRQGAASRASRVAQRVIAAILPGRTEERQMTPLLRWGNAVLKLELFRPRGAVSDRAPPPADGAELTGNQALSFARHGGELARRGVGPHERRGALRLSRTRPRRGPASRASSDCSPATRARRLPPGPTNMAESRSSAGQASANSPWTCRHEDGGPPRRRRTRVSRRPSPRGREGRPQADHRGPGPHRVVESRAPDPLWRGRHRRGEGRDPCRAHVRGGARRALRRGDRKRAAPV